MSDKALRNTTIISMILIALLVSPNALAGPKQTAQKILKETGTKGGLIVHLGCGDGRLTRALLAGDSYLVHGLDTDQTHIDTARKNLASKKAYGKVSVDAYDGKHLPYAENLVNLIVVEDVASVSTDELMRVLAPNGVAYIKKNNRWEKAVKPWPEAIDQWTHYLYDPTNNAVSRDKAVGPPNHLRWAGLPKFARAHEQLASISAIVTANGRLFYIIDEGPRADIRLPTQWRLVARDAFNGVILWKRPIDACADHLRRFRSGPPDLPYRLVAVEDKVYVTEGIDAPLTVLDAATGKKLWTYDKTEHTRLILHLGERIVLLIDTQPQTTKEDESNIRRGVKPAPGKREILIVDSSADKTLWRKEIGPLVHPTIAAQNNRLFYQTMNTLFCLNLDNAEEIWRAPIKTELKGHEVGWETPTLVVQDDIVYYADFRQMTAFAAKDGKRLWDGAAAVGYNAPPDIFIIEDLLWKKDKQVKRIAFDPATGTQKREIQSIKGYMHHRCYRNKATEKFIILGNQGVQFLDLDSGENRQNYWIRGTCQYGIMPANGLLYVPPDSCACNLKTKLNGFYALAATRKPAPKLQDDTRLEKGTAYNDIRHTTSDIRKTDWPTYRADPARSGITNAKLPAKLDKAWQAGIGGRLSSVTVAEGKAFVASIDKHTIYAIDTENGKTAWTYTAGGRIDSPPTIHKGLALFGSADGYIYALIASDGRLAWRFRAAPEDRRTFVNGQLESVWPVHGSVLVKDDTLIAAAGRSSYLDGGIHFYRLDPLTGKQISHTCTYSPVDGKQPPEGGKELRGALSDILSAIGDDVYMRHMKVDFAEGTDTQTGTHLFTPTGFLDDTWWHRSYWVLNDKFLSHWSAWWRIGNQVPSGRILSYNESEVFGYGRNKYVSGNTGQWRGGEKYQLFAHDRGALEQPATPAPPKKGKRAPAPPPIKYRWTKQILLFVTAMLVAEDKIFVAGPPDIIKAQAEQQDQALVLENPDEALQTWTGQKGGAILCTVSTENGEALEQYKLDSQPVFDGMAAANGRLYIAQKNGKLICLEKK
ncbi:MAG: outer membrane protein assembly factor BamB family protein [Planctomycetota bacterium]|jgi:outer membrane protein assembly factor BamB